jgi:signal transduction histidine kinase
MKRFIKRHEWDKKIRIKYSLFSFYWVVLLFIMTGVSILYTLTVYQRLTAYLETTESETMKFVFGLGAFLSLCLLFTTISGIFRRITVRNPIMRILRTTQRIGAGDFTVRLPEKRRFRNEYDLIFENLNKLAEELSGIETLRQDFISNVSHEFKAPLALIQSSGEILMRADLTEEDRRKYARNVCDASKRLASMITNILTLNKIENRQLNPRREKLNLAEQLREDVLLFEPLWTDKEIAPEIDADDSLYIYADPELTSLMWRNLLSNAFKFTPAGGTVKISAKKTDGRIQVCVSDSGPGIPETQQSRIFEKFFQGDRSHVTQGNGLGLALVKSVADLFNYRITLNSAPGKGCAFTVTLT